MSPGLLALQITLVGMGLVFGAILILWGLMYLLTVLIREPKAAPEPETPPRAEQVKSPASDLAVRAAAAAVALALANQSSSNAHPLTVAPPTLVSAWQLGMRTRQMTQKGSTQNKGKR